MNAFPIDQQVGGRRHFLSRLVGAVQRDRLQLHPKDATGGVDFFAGHQKAIAMFNTVHGQRPGQRGHLTNLDGARLLGVAGIDPGQGGGAEAGGCRRTQEGAATDPGRGKRFRFAGIHVKSPLLPPEGADWFRLSLCCRVKGDPAPGRGPGRTVTS